MSTSPLPQPRPGRRPYDHYQTPPELARAAITALPPIDPRRILDLGAGDGVWGAAARERWPYAHIVGTELRDVPQPAAYDAWHHGDALTLELPKADLVIGNPPFDQAAAFVARALELKASGGIVALLLRLSFAEPAQDRAELLMRAPIWRVLVATPRPRFDPDRSGSDSAAPGLFLWHPSASPHHRPIGALRWKGGAR